MLGRPKRDAKAPEEDARTDWCAHKPRLLPVVGARNSKAKSTVRGLHSSVRVRCEGCENASLGLVWGEDVGKGVGLSKLL